MLRTLLLASAIFGALGIIPSSSAEEVLFEEQFDQGLSDKWQKHGLKEDDYRIRDGALELRVQPGRRTSKTPMLMILLPFTTSESIVASVEMTPLNAFTEPNESAGLFLTDADSREFGAQAKNINGHLVYSPGNVNFIGQQGEEGDPQKYSLTFLPFSEQNGPLKIIVRGHYGHFQVGPSKKGKYLNFFHSALRDDEPQRGFCLSASGGPEDEEHWVRFDNFRVTRN